MSINAVGAVAPALTDTALSVQGLEVVYNDVLLVLRGVSLEVPAKSIVAMLGSNGAGKTTLLRAITGLLPVHRGRITKGSIEFMGREIQRHDAPAIVRSGIAQVMEGRRVFAEMTVDENLRAGGLARRDRAVVRDCYLRVLDLFPTLADRRRSLAGYLSGGQQQMLAIGQALMADPTVLVLDEPSLGLGATFVPVLRQIIVEINRQGTGVLLVEQNADANPSPRRRTRPHPRDGGGPPASGHRSHWGGARARRIVLVRPLDLARQHRGVLGRRPGAARLRRATARRW